VKKLVVLLIVLLIPVLLIAAFTRSVRAAENPPPVHHPSYQEDVSASPQSCEDGYQDSGAVYRICMPPAGSWNGDLLVYAHGYMAFNRAVEIPEDQMVVPGTSTTIDQVANMLGYGFATTSYYTNGLAVLPALSDLVDLVDVFTGKEGEPDDVYLVGVSEGGLITTLSVEQHPDVFDGGLAMCGPYGDFSGQVDHFGDFRVVFDYFFPGLMPEGPVDIPGWLVETWESEYYSTTVQPVIKDESNVGKVDQLLAVTGVSPYSYEPPTSTNVIENLLWYNVFATNDGKAKLGGQPFDNQDRLYSGADDDAQLNAGVERFSANPVALDQIAANYQTTGILTVPLVTLHTTGDPVVPYWHATRYRGKTIVADNIALHEHIRVDRHGHCSFTADEVVGAFNRLVAMVENPPPYQPVKRVFLPVVAAER